LQSIVAEAGWPIWLLLALSVVGLALIVERALSLRSTRVIPPELAAQVQQMVRAGNDSPAAIEKLADSCALGQILAEVLRTRQQPASEMRQAVEDTGQDVAHTLQRYLPALATVATIAPLLGLFGTVIGMIEIFAVYRPDGADPSQMAHGISVALYNTAFGILIAIPAMIAHRLYRSRVEGLLLRMEQIARQVAQRVRG
jgi:biopolymer transport protein ExbB